MQVARGTPERGGIRQRTMATTRIPNNQWSLEHCSVLCIVPFAALCSKMCPPTPPPPNPYISETAFSHRFQKVTPPPGNENLVHWTKI